MRLQLGVALVFFITVIGSQSSTAQQSETTIQQYIYYLFVSINELNTRISELEADTARLEALEAKVANLDEIYTVYDQTGRAVGTTKDGQIVKAEFEGFDEFYFNLRVGGELEPDFSNQTAAYFFSPDCSGPPHLYLPLIDIDEVERMSGVEYKEGGGILKNPDGGYLASGPIAEFIEWSGGSIFNDRTGECSDYSSSPWGSNILVASSVPIIIDWVPPLTAIPPQ